jgi:Family of unknown function (DUF6281)
MKWIVGAAAVASLLAGCGGGQEPGGEVEPRGEDEIVAAAADCVVQVRFEGTIYSGTGYSAQKGTRIGIADESNCDDIGENARGPYFPSDPRQVEVVAFEGIPTTEAVGVRYGKRLTVFVSEDVPANRAEQLLAGLAKPAR